MGQGRPCRRDGLSLHGEEIELESPRMVRKKDIWPLLPTATKTPPGISEESELLRMDVADKTETE